MNEILKKGHRLTSENGQFYAILQEDNNFVLYRAADKNALWATHTSDTIVKNAFLVLQDDGNLVMYNPPFNPGKRSNPIWSTQTNGKCHNPRLIMQDDGNLVLYND